MRTRRQAWMLLGIVCGALIVRLAALLCWPAEVLSDAVTYEGLGWRLARGLGYTTEAGVPTAFFPPLYSYVIGGIYALAGREPMAVRVVQAVLSALIPLAVYDIVRTLWGRKDAALLAAALAALDFALILYPRLLLTETVFAALLALAMFAWARAYRSDRLGWWAMFGTATGCAALTRPPIQFLPLVALAAWPFTQSAGHARLKRWCVVALVALGTFCATLAPWIWRNARAFQFVTTQLTSSSGTGLYISYRPQNGWQFGLMDANDPLWAEGLRIKRRGTLHAEWERSEYLAQGIAADLAARPWLPLALAPLKLGFLLYPFDWSIFNGEGRMDVSFLFSLPFAVLGGWWIGTAGGWRGCVPLWLMLAYTAAISMIFLGAPRFRMPVQPYLHAFAALGLCTWAQRQPRWRPWLAAWSAVVLLLGMTGMQLKDALVSVLRGHAG